MNPFIPCNRYVLIERGVQNKRQSLIELPEGAFPDETHERVVITGVSSNVRPPISPGNQAVVLSHMIEEVEFEGEKLNLILENHILGIFEKET